MILVEETPVMKTLEILHQTIEMKEPLEISISRIHVQVKMNHQQLLISMDLEKEQLENHMIIVLKQLIQMKMTSTIILNGVMEKQRNG
jgi:hypothetical protein